LAKQKKVSRPPGRDPAPENQQSNSAHIAPKKAGKPSNGTIPKPRAAAQRPAPATLPLETKTMKATWNGVTIAESDDTVLVEGNHYFPMSSLNRDAVTFSNHKTTCPWKGTASYYSLLVNGELNTDAAWYYADPKPEAEEIRDRVAFWKDVKVSAQ
jgi:uncharacterized protein (DUF427 family)